MGCAPATIQGLKERHSGSYSFTVDENYQSVYRKILTKARACYQTGMITAQMVVAGDLYNDIKKGDISVALHGGLGVDTYLYTEIKAIDENKSNVDVYYALDTWKKAANAVKAWVLNNYEKCGKSED